MVFIRDLLALCMLSVATVAWLLWQAIKLPFRYWKTVAILVLSFINIVSFLAAANKEALFAFKLQRLVAVADAQRFAYRSLGIAEMETLRANDLEARLELERELNAQLREQLEALGVERP